jgi:hypothetical protein
VMSVNVPPTSMARVPVRVMALPCYANFRDSSRR